MVSIKLTSLTGIHLIINHKPDHGSGSYQAKESMQKQCSGEYISYTYSNTTAHLTWVNTFNFPCIVFVRQAGSVSQQSPQIMSWSGDLITKKSGTNIEICINVRNNTFRL